MLVCLQCGSCVCMCMYTYYMKYRAHMKYAVCRCSVLAHTFADGASQAT